MVFAQLDDFKAWATWSPWEKMDPQMKKTFAGPARGVGASYAWQDNDKVGKGKMTITETNAPSSVTTRLEFIEPFTAVATAKFTVAGSGDASTVTWSMDGTHNLMGKIFGIFMNMDTAIGGDFEKGLASLRDGRCCGRRDGTCRNGPGGQGQSQGSQGFGTHGRSGEGGGREVLSRKY